MAKKGTVQTQGTFVPSKKRKPKKAVRPSDRLDAAVLRVQWAVEKEKEDRARRMEAVQASVRAGVIPAMSKEDLETMLGKPRVSPALQRVRNLL